MAGTKSPSSNWCPLRDSDEIKTAVRHRMKTRCLTQSKLGDLTDIQDYRISKYLRGVKPNITQYQLFKICSKLGIEIDIVVKFIE